jgi:hypothetical protein
MKKNLPALPFMKVVAQFAHAKGLKFFTWQQQLNAITIYEANASVLN